jgi:hypothetical protein
MGAHAKLQNPRITPSGRKVTTGERRKKKKRKKMLLIVVSLSSHHWRTQTARTKLNYVKDVEMPWIKGIVYIRKVANLKS